MNSNSSLKFKSLSNLKSLSSISSEVFMRISDSGTSFTERNQHIRMCIAKTLVKIMEVKNIDEITITELVKKANVSRMTFYKYYKSKVEVLSDYMYEIVNDYIEDTRKKEDIGGLHDYKHICHCFQFFKQFSGFFKTLLQANMYSVIINALNNYMDSYVSKSTIRSKYELYYYAGALCNTYIKWLETGMVESPEEISKIVYEHVITT